MDSASTCQHLHGGSVPGHIGWVCGQCWNTLESRPRKYGPAPLQSGGTGAGSRQQIIWQADERRTSHGMTLGQFLIIIAQRFAVRGRLDRASAMELALSAMRALMDLGPEFEFADSRSEWTREAAIDIADEEMSYWDSDREEANG